MAPRLKLSELKKLYAERWNYPPAQKPNKIKFLACGDNPEYGIIEKSFRPCWKSPTSMTADARFGPCWDYPPERCKRYSRPPPCRGGTMPANFLLPSIDHCKTQYTRFDFRLEQCVHQQIQFIEQLFRNMDDQLAEAKVLQIEMAKKLRYQAVRRRLLIGSACGVKIYPEYLSQMAEKRGLCEFQKARNIIDKSNAELAASVLAIRNAMPELRSRLNKLDRTLDSPFLANLETVLQTIQDLYDYFFEVVRKYKTWAQLIDAAQEHSVDDYLGLLCCDCDFESFKRIGTEQCTCKRNKNNNPLEPYLPCWCQGCDRRNKDIQILQTDLQYHRKIEAKLDSSESGYMQKHISSGTSLLMSEVDEE